MNPHFRIDETECREMKSLFLGCPANKSRAPCALPFALGKVLRIDEFLERMRKDREKRGGN